jgi:hypothetical protein
MLAARLADLDGLVLRNANKSSGPLLRIFGGPALEKVLEKLLRLPDCILDLFDLLELLDLDLDPTDCVGRDMEE